MLYERVNEKECEEKLQDRKPLTLAQLIYWREHKQSNPRQNQMQLGSIEAHMTAGHDQEVGITGDG